MRKRWLGRKPSVPVDPTPEQIAKATAEIRATWSPEEEQKRRVVGRYVRVHFPELPAPTPRKRLS